MLSTKLTTMYLMLLLLLNGWLVKSVDYCLQIGNNPPGMPKAIPTRAVIYDGKGSHGSNLRGFALIVSELNMTLDHVDRFHPIGNPDILWSPFVDVAPEISRLSFFGPEFDILPGDPTYSGFHTPRYQGGHAFYDVLAEWNVIAHASLGGWKYPMIPLRFAVDIEHFLSPYGVNAPERYDGIIYFKRRDPAILQQVQDFLKSKQLENSTVLFDYLHR